MRTLKFITALLITIVVFGAAHAQESAQKNTIENNSKPCRSMQCCGTVETAQHAFCHQNKEKQVEWFSALLLTRESSAWRMY